jgi:hypothetical protein
MTTPAYGTSDLNLDPTKLNLPVNPMMADTRGLYT